MKKLKLVKQIYQAADGSEWVIEKVTLPKKRGEWSFWTAEGKDAHFRHEQKGRLKMDIEAYVSIKMATTPQPVSENKLEVQSGKCNIASLKQTQYGKEES